jgi:hypothetical protein
MVAEKIYILHNAALAVELEMNKNYLEDKQKLFLFQFFKLI